MTKEILKIALLIICSNSFGQAFNEKYIEVTGTSEKELAPDNIEITVILRANENVKKENELQEREKQIVLATKQFNIPDNDISIDKIAGHRYGYYKTSSNKYQISKVFKIQLQNSNILDDLIIKLFEVGANNVYISKMTSNLFEEMKTEAAKDALNIAKKRAQDIAKTMGLTIGDALQIRELGPKVMNYDVPYSADRIQFQARGLSEFEQMGTENFNIRKILLTYTVSVRFEIE